MLLKLAGDHVSKTGWKDRKFLRGHERERRPSPLDLVCFTCLLRVKKQLIKLEMPFRRNACFPK